MDDNNKKIRAIAFILAGVIVAVTVDVLFEALAGSFGRVAILRNNDTLKHGLPLGLGFLTFVLLQFNPRVRVWADECITEVKKVVWPSKKEVVAMTIVVCVMVTIVGIGLGIFDFVAGKAITTLVQTNLLN